MFLLLLPATFGISCAAEDKESASPPLPSNLSKDSQFIIYYVDQRINHIDQRINHIDQRIAALQKYIDQRINMMQREMDKRFEQVDKRFEQIDKRFEQVDKRFEQVDKRFDDFNRRFDQMMTFLWILTGIFTTLTTAVIGFAYWDRRTIIRQARIEAIEHIKREGPPADYRRLLDVLRAFAEKNADLKEILYSFKLL